MSITVVLYILCTLLIWWGYSGYVMLLFLSYYVRRVARPAKREDFKAEDFPSVTVIVPCFNEEKFIGDKIENLRSLEYPQEKLKVVFADGGSTDRTTSIIKEGIRGQSNYRLVVAKKRGKIHQLNEVFGGVDSDVIVNTDVDGFMEKDCLTEMAKEFMRDSNVGVVGAYVSPKDCIPEERLYWKNNNTLRLLESGLLSSSIVIAVCYGFRRGVIEKFPGDVIADDIYLPFQASLNGYRIVYSENALAYELRASQSLGELYKHKMRKSNAFLIEIFRFLGKTLKGRRRWWMIFITRMLQMVVIPLLIPVYFILSLAVGFAGESTLLLASLSLVGVSVFISHMLFQRMRHGVDTMEANIISSAKVFMLMNLIQLVSIIRYPFFRQTSSYEKIR